MVMPALTALRAFRAWWVVAFHTLPLTPFGVDQGATWLHYGALSVDAFFVLSGFVLYSAYPVILDRDRPHLLRDYLVARFARVYPAHFFTLCAFVALFTAAHVLRIRMHVGDGYTVGDLLRQFLLLDGSVYPMQLTWNFPSWSVAAEAVAYLCAPLTFIVVGHLSMRGVMLAAIAMFVPIFALTQTGWMEAGTHAVPRVLMEFALGALLFRTVKSHRTALLPDRRWALPLAFLLIACGIRTHEPGVVVAALIDLIVFLSLRLENHRGFAGRIEAAILYLGETSYAVYLCHAFVLALWAGASTRVHLAVMHNALASGIILTLAIQSSASLLHHFVEHPARRWIRANLAGKRPVVVPVLAAAE